MPKAARSEELIRTTSVGFFVHQFLEMTERQFEFNFDGVSWVVKRSGFGVV